MLLHPPEVSVRDGHVRVSAAVELASSSVRMPETLWFEFPERYAELLVGHCDAFATALLLPAMSLGEDLRIESPMSARLAHGMREYQRVFNCWFPDLFKLVKLDYCGFRTERAAKSRAVATAFSGGVDSFYTLLNHLSRSEGIPTFPITHALFIHGFDISFDDADTFSTAAGAYDEMLRDHDVTLVTSRTNARQFVAHLDWNYVHGAVLTSVAIALDELFSRFYIPSSNIYSDFGPWGSDPLIDHLLATESLEVIHDGGSKTRGQKIAAISAWPETHPLLRVCWEHPNGLNNCSRCYNCVLTMLSLELEGALSRYDTFPLPLSREVIRGLRFPGYELISFEEIWGRAIEVNRTDVAADVRYMIRRNRLSLLGQRARRFVARRLGS